MSVLAGRMTLHAQKAKLVRDMLHDLEITVLHPEIVAGMLLTVCNWGVFFCP